MLITEQNVPGARTAYNSSLKSAGEPNDRGGVEWHCANSTSQN